MSRLTLTTLIPLTLIGLAITTGCGTNSTQENVKTDSTTNKPTTITQSNPTPKENELVEEIEEVMVTGSKITAASQDAMTRSESVQRPSPAVKLRKESKIMGHHPARLMIAEPGFFDANTEKYDEVDISEIKKVLTDPVSTFSTDVDTASYTNARRFLTQGQQPPKNSIRVEEFINYFDYQLPAPDSLNKPIAIHTELMATPWNKSTELMRISLQSYRTDFNKMPPLNLVFLLDVSGSMNSPNKLPLMQKSFNLLVSQLRPEDHVSIVVYAGASGVVLEPTSGNDKQTILDAINQLNAGGSTHGSAGIHLAYQMASKHFSKKGINRVILGTDGDFNVGTTNINQLKDLIEQKRNSGVFLSVLGFGQGNYNDHLMEEISNHGNGNAYYIDSFQEARKVFSEQLASTLQTVAKDVKIQVEFNPNQVAEYRLVGYDNRQLRNEDFNNDKIDAGEMGAGHSVTALYEIVRTESNYRFTDPLRYQTNNESKLKKSDSSEIAFVKVRYKLPEQSNSQLLSVPVDQDSKQKPSQSMVLASSVAGFAERLRNSPYVHNWEHKELIDSLKSTLSNDPWGYRQELLQLVRNSQAMHPSSTQ